MKTEEGTANASGDDWIAATKDMDVAVANYETRDEPVLGVSRNSFLAALGKVSEPDEPQPDGASK